LLFALALTAPPPRAEASLDPAGAFFFCRKKPGVLQPRIAFLDDFTSGLRDRLASVAFGVRVEGTSLSQNHCRPAGPGRNPRRESGFQRCFRVAMFADLLLRNLPRLGQQRVAFHEASRSGGQVYHVTLPPVGAPGSGIDRLALPLHARKHTADRVPVLMCVKATINSSNSRSAL
jgi:hypothetical protein